MKLSEITKEDGINCAYLINSLKVARFDSVTGEDVDKIVQARKWLISIAQQMAAQLKSSTPAPAAPTSDAPAGGFKIKAMGPIGSKPSKSKKRK